MNDLRQIKFRAWDREDKKYYKVVLIGFAVGEAKLQSGQYEAWRPLRDVVLEQFTGLYDSCGKEIYEGDIVEYKFRQGWEDVDIYRRVIHFRNGQFYPIPDKFECEDSFYSFEYYDFNIIGNIHENPKLTEQL